MGTVLQNRSGREAAATITPLRLILLVVQRRSVCFIYASKAAFLVAKFARLQCIFSWALLQIRFPSRRKSGPMSYILQQSAFLTAILHSLKFPQYAVVGLLLGKSGSQPNTTANDNSDKASAESASDSPVIVEDALPLFHTTALLLPMLELALMQVRARACMYV